MKSDKICMKRYKSYEIKSKKKKVDKNKTKAFTKEYIKYYKNNFADGVRLCVKGWL